MHIFQGFYSIQSIFSKVIFTRNADFPDLGTLHVGITIAFSSSCLPNLAGLPQKVNLFKHEKLKSPLGVAGIVHPPKNRQLAAVLR